MSTFFFPRQKTKKVYSLVVFYPTFMPSVFFYFCSNALHILYNNKIAEFMCGWRYIYMYVLFFSEFVNDVCYSCR